MSFRTFRSGLLAVGAVTVVALAFSGCDDSTGSSSSKTYRAGDTTVHTEGEDNFRDLGGYAGVDGRRILFGNLFRSGALNGLTAADRDTVVARGIEQVIDLRTDAEIATAADSLPTSVVSYHLPLIADVSGSTGSTSSLMASILSGSLSGEDYMISLYDSIDSLKIANWTRIFDLLETGKPTLWHCTAGKDRAGMTTALVLSALGVDSATIVRDFLKSNTYLSAYIETQVSYLDAAYGAGTGELLRPVFGVESSYIEAFFGAVNQQYGSMHAFLGALGADTTKLRSLYLEN